LKELLAVAHNEDVAGGSLHKNGRTSNGRLRKSKLEVLAIFSFFVIGESSFSVPIIRPSIYRNRFEAMLEIFRCGIKLQVNISGKVQEPNGGETKQISEYGRWQSLRFTQFSRLALNEPPKPTRLSRLTSRSSMFRCRKNLKWVNKATREVERREVVPSVQSISAGCGTQ
jgi:hypothetical protein